MTPSKSEPLLNAHKMQNIPKGPILFPEMKANANETKLGHFKFVKPRKYRRKARQRQNEALPPA